MGGSKSKPKVPQTPEEFEREMVEWHNTFRSQHGMSPLKTSTNCRQIAQDWADTISQTGHFEHNVSQHDFGESLFKGDKLTTAKQVVSKWYDERLEYDYESPTFSHRTGHFTQIVWRETEFIGVGRALKDDTMFVVVNYDPPGNIVHQGQYEDNVIKPKGEIQGQTK